MSSLLSLGFEFKGTYYSFLARVKEKGLAKEYYITVMNGDLEKLLYGNHIITGTNGSIEMERSAEGNEQSQLKGQIVRALNQYLNEQSLTGV